MKNKFVSWHESNVTKIQRAKQKGQKPCIIWFTGLSGSGKSTLANALEVRLHELNRHTFLLDGDNIRLGLNSDLGFDENSRTENIRRIGEVAKLFVDSGTIVLTAFISPFVQDRKIVRNLVQEGEFIEIFVDTPIDLCEKRDPKGLYKKARNGEIKNFTGIGSPYERPTNPQIHIKNSEVEINENIDKIILYLEQNGYLDA